MAIGDLPASVLWGGAARAEVAAAMRAFYELADHRIAEKAARCWNKGECCRFGEYGHRLYVTTLEVCYYLGRGQELPPVPADACPHAVGGRCRVRSRRPLGCRVFYCDPEARGWQGPLTEELLAGLRALHRELEIPYLYEDWVTVLRALCGRGAPE